MLASSATASPSSTSAAAARAIARLRSTSSRRRRSKPTSDWPLLSARTPPRTRATSPWLRERRRGRSAPSPPKPKTTSASSATVNGIACLEQPQHLLHPLLLRETRDFARLVDGRDLTPPSQSVKDAVAAFETVRSKVDSQSVGESVQTARGMDETCSIGSAGSRSRRRPGATAIPARAFTSIRGPGRPGRARADRRRRTRAQADRALPDASRCTFPGTQSTITPSCAASPRGRASGSAPINPNLFGDDATGWAASAIPTARSRAGGGALPRVRRIAEEVGSSSSASGSPTAPTIPARTTCGPSRAARRWALAGLRGASAGHADARRVQVLRARLLQHGSARLGHCGSRCAGGSGRKRRSSSTPVTTPKARTSSRSSRSCWRKACSAASTSTTASTPMTTSSSARSTRSSSSGSCARSRRPRGDRVAYMIDQSHNIEGKIDAMIQSVMNIQTAYAKALLVDAERLQRPSTQVTSRRPPRAPGRVRDRRATAPPPLPPGPRRPADPVAAFRESSHPAAHARARGTAGVQSAYERH